MGKKQLISGALWEQYSRKVRGRMDNPTYRGEITEAEASDRGLRLVCADWGAEACGDAVRLYWLVDTKTEVIRDAKFLSFGCGTAIASSDMMCELCVGKKVSDVLQINNLVVEQALRDDPDTPAVPPQKMHCSVMAHDVLKLAVSIYTGVSVESLEDREIVCACARVSRGTIKDAIRLNDLKTVEQVTQYTKAGGFCKSCIRHGGHEKKESHIEDILRETRAEMDLELRLKLHGDPARVEPERAQDSTAETHMPAANTRFRDMNPVRMGNAIQAIIDRELGPLMAKDGGHCDVVDVKLEGMEGRIVVYIEYGGACASCPSSKTHTLVKIEEAIERAAGERVAVRIVG
jgi:NifU-like protein